MSFYNTFLPVLGGLIYSIVLNDTCSTIYVNTVSRCRLDLGAVLKNMCKESAQVHIAKPMLPQVELAPGFQDAMDLRRSYIALHDD